ncbi:MAG: toll/interleukin-1 receptor domain-containing protein, partial [Delftia sp.]|nr:toll/interleukin-1 receptor domain-containing protein [Delftia sp.]
VEPLVAALEERGLTVWYDADQIRLGDDFRRAMDQGLSSSAFAVVVLSPSFLKYWPEAELSALFAQESVWGEKRILPLRHGIDRATVVRQWPMLSARASPSTADGLDTVADELAAVVLDSRRQRAGPASRVYNLPLGTQGFVGRGAELEQLAGMLGKSQSVRVTAAVEGLAGVGKSELAIQLALRLAGSGVFPGGIFWLVAENPDLTAAWGGAIADQLGVAMMPLAERAALTVRQVSRASAAV